jgi:hypothetical protein
MNTPLAVEFQPDPAQTVRASRAIQQRGWLSWISWAIWPLLAGLALLYRFSGVPWRDMGLLAATAVFLAVLAFGAPRIQRWQVRRAYQSSPMLRERQRYEFSPSGLTVRGGLASTSLGWDAITEAVETDEFFLLFFARKSAYYVPKGALVSESERADLRELLRASLGARAAGLREPARAVAVT